MWRRLVGTPDEAPPPRAWFATVTPLAADCDLALQVFHCTPGEFYRRTTWQERLALRIHLAYRQEQEQAAREHDELVRANEEQMRAQLGSSVPHRP